MARMLDEADDVLALVRELGDDLVGIRVQIANRPVLRRQDPQRGFELSERRRAEADRLVQLLGIAGKRGPEFVDQDGEAVLVGLAQRVLDEVRLDRLGDLSGRDRATLGKRWSLRAAGQEILRDQRLRLRGAAGVLAQGAERPRCLDCEVRALVLCDVESRHRAGVDARDPQVGALDDAEGVVHLDVVRVRVVRTGHGRQPGGEAYEQGYEERDPSHGPTGTWEGSQARVPLSVNGVELSPGSRSLAPGQRARLLSAPPIFASSAIGDSGGVLGRPALKALKVVAIRPMPPLASSGPDVPKWRAPGPGPSVIPLPAPP